MLSLSRRLVGHFDSIVRVLAGVMGDVGNDVSLGDTVTAEAVGHEPNRWPSLTLQECAKESLRGTPITTRLDEDVDDVTVLVDRPPEILAPPANRHEHFVHEPGTPESASAPLRPPRIVGTELLAPQPNGFIGDDDAALTEQILDIPVAEAVAVVQPHGVADDVWWNSMPRVAARSICHPDIVRRGELNLTEPLTPRSAVARYVPSASITF
jgi:hypothetical protein